MLCSLVEGIIAVHAAVAMAAAERGGNGRECCWILRYSAVGWGLWRAAAVVPCSSGCQQIVGCVKLARH